ncbi:MAG: LCP family protein [Candidatus Andersenbacteria bacterium]|nr:LCP family protein [Candidatus Andersenbacteria bacterium]MBI3251015.1 LCP family protein [Candidatus Andersenbacteria bacterium]
MTASTYPGPGLPPRAQRGVLRDVRRRYRLSDTVQTEKTAPTRTIAPPAPRRRSTSPRRRRSYGSWLRRIVLLLFVLGIIGGGAFGYRILAASNKITVTDRSLFGQIKDLLFSSGEFLAGEEEGRINVMLLAVGGEGHSGENLADTIMVVSIHPKNGDVSLLSIPRDLYVQVPGEDYFSKINSVHAIGEAQGEHKGPQLLREKVEEITGQPIHYYARVDFTAFKSIVDAVGGVNITIENSFTDYWHKISFPAGTETMNGERALAYARARYIEGPEGGDFKRAARQQQLLLALREKVFSVNTAFDFGAVNQILESLANNIRTDMQLWEMKRFFELARLIDRTKVHSVVLTTGHNGVLVGTTEVLGGQPASVLRTRTGDYSEIQSIAANIFSEDVSKSIEPTQAPTTPTPAPAEKEEEQAKPSVEIRNGTNVAGLAARTRDQLTSEGYEVTGIGNAATRDKKETVVYQIANTAADGVQAIAELLEASSTTDVPEDEAESEADVLIILGADAE